MSTIANTQKNDPKWVSFLVTLAIWVTLCWLASIYMNRLQLEVKTHEADHDLTQDSLDRYKQHRDSVESFQDHSRIPDN